MGKENKTAASKAHPPEKKVAFNHPHAYAYPGVAPAKPSKVVDAKNNDKAHAEGLANSIGQSADGSHKGFHQEPHPIFAQGGHNGAKPGKFSKKNGAAEQAAGMKNSMGKSASGSHKGLPSNSGTVRQ